MHFSSFLSLFFSRRFSATISAVRRCARCCARICASLLGASVLWGCEASGFGDFFGSPSINDYIEDYAVQALLLVDEPIEDIRILRTVDVQDSFSFEKSAVRNAEARIIENGRAIPLRFDPARFSYQAADASERVKPNAEYRFEATLRNSSGQIVTLRGATTTPERVRWILAPKDTLWYPKDTMALPSPDSLRISWTPVPNIVDYIFSTECLDTLEYGKYLRPPTDEKNRRIERFFESRLPRYNEPVRAGIRAVTQSPVIWTAFKWFGVHELRIYAPDRNWANWFRQTNFSQNPRYNPALGSIEGGIGVFGSASFARQRTFLYKNQP